MRANYIYIGCVLNVYNRDIETGKIMWYTVTKYGESIEDCILYVYQDEFEDNKLFGYECYKVTVKEVLTYVYCNPKQIEYQY